MTARAKTIQIFLPHGNPRGVRIADITSRNIAAVLVPRAKLDDAFQRDELDNVGVYVLIGEGESRPLAYIGEAENCIKRLRSHNKQKDFWTHALVFVSKTKDFTKSHIKYLEWSALQTAQSLKRFSLENGNSPNRPHVSEPVAADLEDHFETMRILASTLGYPIFDQPHRPKRQKLIYCRGKDAKATGEYGEDGLTVFEGSICNLEETPTVAPGTTKLREGLVKDGVLIVEEGVLKLTADQVFSSPSAAAGVVLGRRANGWREWKYKDGKTLDDVHRSD
jgi:hypothetical protein